MEELRFTVKALASVSGMTVAELAEACGISVAHLQNVSAGRTRLTADDLIRLSDFTKVPPGQITDSRPTS